MDSWPRSPPLRRSLRGLGHVTGFGGFAGRGGFAIAGVVQRQVQRADTGRHPLAEVVDQPASRLSRRTAALVDGVHTQRRKLDALDIEDFQLSRRDVVADDM